MLCREVMTLLSVSCGTDIHCMGKMQSFLVLNLVAHIIVTTEPERF